MKNRETIHDVIVLGAGLAGLTAAYQLTKKKKDVLVLEAASRLGGRVFTDSISKKDGLTIELGGEWIGKTHKKIVKLCKELGVELEDHLFREIYVHHVKRKNIYKMAFSGFEDPFSKSADNNPISKIEKKFHISHTKALKNKKFFDGNSLYNLFKQSVSKKALDFYEIVESLDIGESTRNVAAAEMIMAHIQGGKNYHMDYHIKGGNWALPHALAEQIGKHNILLNHQVVKIDQQNRIVTITTRNGMVFKSKKVVCALPATALTKIQWRPLMPHALRSSAENLNYSRIIKIAFLFEKRFWKREDFALISDGLAQYVYHTTKLQNAGSGVLCLYAVGEKAEVLSRMSPREKYQELLKVLPPDLKAKRYHPKKIKSYYWPDDPFTEGAYAVYDLNQYYKTRKLLGTPFKNVLFAGEHTAVFQGFMEGAVESGLKAARLIV